MATYQDQLTNAIRSVIALELPPTPSEICDIIFAAMGNKPAKGDYEVVMFNVVAELIRQRCELNAKIERLTETLRAQA